MKPIPIIKPPLQVILVRHGRDVELLNYQEAVLRGFTGAASPSGYSAYGEDLGAEIRQYDESVKPLSPIGKTIEGACHTLIVVFADSMLIGDKGLTSFVETCWDVVHRSRNRHTLLVLALNEEKGRELIKAARSLNANHYVSLEKLGEEGIRPVMAALRALHEARKLLADAISKSRPNLNLAFLRLFISHAKIDGLPLAQSLKHLLDAIPWLSSFYDARGLAGETDWQKALGDASRSSLLIILRTDVYETRHWCRQEVLWAEEIAAPTVIVEARPGLSYPAGELPLERMPSVRIPDGNLFRVINAALRESLRHLMFQRRVKEMQSRGVFRGFMVKPFSYPPSMTAIINACGKIKNSKAVILYPDPPMRRGVYESGCALVEKLSPNALLATPATLTTLFAAKP